MAPPVPEGHGTQLSVLVSTQLSGETGEHCPGIISQQLAPARGFLISIVFLFGHLKFM